MNEIKYIDEEIIKNKKILLRVDFNVTLSDKLTIIDDARMRQTLPTIEYLLKNKNKLIIISHLGRPKGREKKFSLKAVAAHLHTLLPDYKAVLVDDFQSDDGWNQIINQKENEILMLENIRYYSGEKENSIEFAKRLSFLGQIFVNDAFGVSHRKDASIVSIPKFLPSYGGLLLKKETEILSHLLNGAKKPFVVILGGAKVSTKIGLIKKMAEIANYILLGGGMANTFIKAMGLELGKSLVENDEVENARNIMSFAKKNGAKIIMPKDVVVGDLKSGRGGEIFDIDKIPKDSQALDIGPKTREEFIEIIEKANTIVWNGPVGYTEDKKYRAGNNAIYNAVIKNSDACSVAGGGDTLASIANEENLKKISHISSGGGAMLEFIENGTLPGIEALRQSNSSLGHK
ncbi:MAG: phosphoglycerate kinase [Candidatus Levybacteria bacterium CG10_big_fil_rev_8_21_14_0_10_36_7]|nr:MAG: phosphoglycerate kinase [Candidatus Levybacteria bacterium CG10_big_fil_rev_8_21_14_0_10_36_7]